MRSPRRNRRRSMPQSGLRPLPGRPIDHCAGGALLLAVIKTKSCLTSNALIMSPCGETPRPLPCGRFWIKDDGSDDKTEGDRGVSGCRACDRVVYRPRSSHGAGPDQYRPGQVAGGDLRHRLRDLPQVGAGAGQRAGQLRPRQLPASNTIRRAKTRPPRSPPMSWGLVAVRRRRRHVGLSPASAPDRNRASAEPAAPPTRTPGKPDQAPPAAGRPGPQPATASRNRRIEPAPTPPAQQPAAVVAEPAPSGPAAPDTSPAPVPGPSAAAPTSPDAGEGAPVPRDNIPD